MVTVLEKKHFQSRKCGTAQKAVYRSMLMKSRGVRNRIIFPYVIIMLIIICIDIILPLMNIFTLKTQLFSIGSILFLAVLGFIIFWVLLGRIQLNLENTNKYLSIKINELEISSREAREAKLSAEKAKRMKNDFLANVSHELRTPLNGILGMTGLVLDTKLDDDQKEFLNMIVESGDHLFRIISDLLDFSQIETGNLAINPVLFNLSNLVKNSISVLKLSADKKNIGLTYSIKPEILYFYGDRVRIGQILINLITNAIKYSVKGNISVSVEISEKLIISIEDKGIGIADDRINSIFDSFYQIENTYLKTHEGVGIGLSIVKQLVELLDGDISVESKHGIGSTFKVLLPCIPAPENAKVIPEKQVVKNYSIFEGLKVLIAEDEAINRIYLKKFLSKKGFIVTEAQNGREVLDLFKLGEFNLILMDMGMPEIDGIDATKQIRELEKKSGEYVKIIALTANAFPEDVRKCVEAGMDHFVSKPINEQDLLNIIEETVNS
jgi:signal transduction histidine kinase/CheY-like chemotaxis protein